jgi:hypothetical protein
LYSLTSIQPDICNFDGEIQYLWLHEFPELHQTIESFIAELAKISHELLRAVEADIYTQKEGNRISLTT